MEKELERYYTEFRQPPLAPTYHPTEEEFADPISYVAKIRPEAEKYGLIKILPPSSFRPPFCIDSAKFEFVPRLQRLNEIDALFRLRIIFINKLVHFWKYSKDQQFRIPYIDNRYIDLYRLRQLVEEEGGLKRVNEARRWSHIAKMLGFRGNAGQSLKQCYTKWIHPFEQSVANKKDQHHEVNNSSSKRVGGQQKMRMEEKAMESTSKMDNCEGKEDEEKSSPQTRSQTRMMAGPDKKNRAKPVPSLDKSSIQGHKTPIELVVCGLCGSGEDEARLLLCETCDASMHTYCARPPLASVPKGEWRCNQCVANAVKSVAMDFGFTDSNQKFTLDAFGEWANLYKQQYFGQAPCDVPSERVEREFWRNVIDIDKGVQVKYGADLISSKVGSGFPRREDNFRGVDARERNFYANHPWNLNNMPKLRESVLCHMTMDISGMMVPWVYVGMLFSTFCWHVEDHWTYSINYNHWGERKIWYGIPGVDAEKFDRVMKETAPELFTEQRDLLHYMITHMNPSYLVDRGIQVYTVHQNAGEFVITFPRAYHAGFNEGLNFAEAVNFAPPDWLKMGRFCLENYASVGRNCVFSHEELVMKMVSVSHKMSIGMCLATLEELSWIVGRETEFRRRLSAAGVHESVFCRFEDIPDDARSCIHCRTTLFCSGLVCRHEGRIICPQHVDKLCNECPLEQCCLKFRYTLEDLVPLVRRLTERTNAFFEWRQSVAQMYERVQALDNDGRDDEKAVERDRNHVKIDVLKMRTLAEQWRSSRFPQCEEIQRINKVLAQFERTAVSIRKVLNRKIRLRDQTRCQKADTRWEYDEVMGLRKQLVDSMFEDKELESGIEEMCQRVENWKVRAVTALARPFGGVQTVDTLYALISEAEEEFNVKLEMEGLDRLKSELTRCQWLVKANKLLELIERKKPMKIGQKIAEEAREREDRKCEEREEDEEEEEEKEKKWVELQRLAKTIADATKWLDSCALVRKTFEKLERFHAEGTESDRTASEFLAENAEGIGFEEAQRIWREVRGGKDDEGGDEAGDWVQSQAMDKFRAELEMAKKVHDDFEQLKCNAFSLRNLEQLENLCSQSLFERGNAQRHAQVRQWLDGLQKFVERIRAIFLKAVTYYNTFDVIAGRSDLPALIEGEPLPLALFTSHKYSENWRQLRAFSSSNELLAHLHAIADQQCTLLHALRLTNAERPPKETCSCAKDTTPPKPTRRGNSHNNSNSQQQQRGKRARIGDGGGSSSSRTSASPPTMVLLNGAATRRKTVGGGAGTAAAHCGGEEDGKRESGTTAATANGVADDNAGGIAPSMLIPCFICNAKFHADCAQWDPFLARLPPGLFLCQRCLRSRRPCIADVEAACYGSAVPENCFERILVQNLIQRATNTFTRLQRLLHSIPKGTSGRLDGNVSEELGTSLKECLSMALSLELMDTEVYSASINSYFDLFPLPEHQIRVWQHVKERMVDSEPLPLIFSLSGGHFADISAATSSGAASVSSKRRASFASTKRRSSQSSQHNKSSLLSSAQSPAKQKRLSAEEEDSKMTKDGMVKKEGREEKVEDGDGRGGEGVSGKHTERCAADFCLRPYSEFTRWIQCEAGCARWYHFCCVGISVRGAQMISAYCCYKCATAATTASAEHPQHPQQQQQQKTEAAANS